ncbi:MAG TPA: 1-(5-phosphoribosyl)-5-[(5-phosphoribosylamino)methylideneamino]imidazole-4-carboxamide isomerase [Dehalococcoidia bacterium]|nr:1-(5-phosphoribosyl)-5-[(5-phosphoribosylamino)methylideneamino]imidazole-4-carboxamide isomerase [Dehalococcoidia bacterium]
MEVIPAIDLRGGRCVRLYQGDFGRETAYGDDPAAMARRWQDAGARRLHVVDLDGARSGEQANAAAVEAILSAVDIPVELGGGIRSLEAIEAWLSTGVDRVYLGTAAVEDPELLREACLLYPGRVGVGADARDGRIAVRGWEDGSGPPVDDFVRAVVEAGAAFVSYTDISRDGTLLGPDFEGVRRLAGLVPPGVELILAGGIGSIEHIQEAAGIPRLDGVIVGRALYDGSLDLRQALAAVHH